MKRFGTVAIPIWLDSQLQSEYGADWGPNQLISWLLQRELERAEYERAVNEINNPKPKDERIGSNK